jgi:hypothetical protein
LPNGVQYSGRYYQITEHVQSRSVGPLWPHWGPYWGYSSWDAFTTYYSGRVVATLDGSDGGRMRCEFTLADPPAGLEHGGTGDCELDSGEEIANVVLREGSEPYAMIED